MTVKVLLIDPEIRFAVPVKRALEMSGDFRVNVFAGGRAALELLAREPHAVAVVDPSVDDMRLRELLSGLRQASPNLFVIVTPKSDAEAAALAGLDVQASLRKPYYARALLPYLSQAMDAPVARKAPPDETFLRATESIHTSHPPAPGSASGQPTGLQIEEPPIPDDATVRDLVSGQRMPKGSTRPMPPLPADLLHEDAPQPDAPPSSLPEPPAAQTSAAAELALEVASDDTVSLEAIPQAIAEKTELIPPDERPAYGALEAEPSFVSNVLEKLISETVGMAAIKPTDTGSMRRVPDTPSEASAAPVLPPVISPPQTPPDLPPVAEAAVSESAAPEPPPPAAPTDPMAALALQLTQLSVDSAAQVALLTKGEHLIAMAGKLPEWALHDVLTEISRAWRAAKSEARDAESEQRPALFRYLQLPGDVDYLLYSTQTVDDMILTMLYPGDVPLRVIRRQARQLRDALEKVPEPPPAPVMPPAAPVTSAVAAAEPAPPAEVTPTAPAAETLPSRTTEVRASGAEAGGEGKPEARLSYAYVWLPRRGELTPDIGDSVRAAADSHGWNVDGLNVQPTHLTLLINVPASITPTLCAERLMQETAARAGNTDLWAEPFYVVSPARPIAPAEIATFLANYREVMPAS